MSLTLNRLLRRGYLPKELPTPFSSEAFGASMRSAPQVFVDGKPAHICVHNLARPGMLRRTLGIPNPVAFHALAVALANGWKDVEAVMAKSPYTTSAPVSRASNRRALVPGGRTDIADARANYRASARFVAFADVSQWYPSIYSHSIAWALHGKAWSKKHRKAKVLGNALDKLLTALQDGQSVGIPIGPDISFALGELVLGACDAELASALSGTSVRGFRYYDDYELYASSRADADRAVTELQKVLAGYQLTLNPHKYEIEPLPLPVEDEWVSAVKRITVRTAVSSERSDLLLLFDEAYRQARAHPSDSVLKYTIGRFVTGTFEWRQRVSGTNWPLFQRLLLQSALCEPGTLEKVTALLAWEKARGRKLDEPNLTDALNVLVAESAKLGHSSEVAWGVYAARKLGVRLSEAVARLVSDTLDDVVALVALDANTRGVFRSGLDTSRWVSWMSRTELYGEHWLAAYEAYEHGWLTGGTDYIAADSAFAHLRAHGVRFYNERRRLQPKASRGVLRVQPSGSSAGAQRPEQAITYAFAAAEEIDVEEPDEVDVGASDVAEEVPY